MANIKNPLVVRLFDSLKQKKVSVPDFAEKTGIPKDRIYKWKQKGTSPKAEDEKIIVQWINSGKMDNVPREEGNYNILLEGRAEESLLDIVRNISKDNSLLIHQHDKIVDTNAKIAETNRLITEQLIKERSTVSEDRYTMIETVSMVRALKESLIDLESKLTKKSPQEIRQVFHSKVKVEREKVESLGTPVEKGK